MQWIEALRAKALLAIYDPDDDAVFRRIFRWYSRTFATPLHEVPELPLEHVLTAWFESHFEDLDPVQLHQELIAATTSDEEAAQIEAADDAFLKAAQEDARKEAEHLRQKLAGAEKPGVLMQPKAPPPPPAETKPVEDRDEIHMTFDDNLPKDQVDHMKSLLQGDPTRAPPPGKK